MTGATVSDITRAAGVAKGTFYLYFESKEDLLAAIRQNSLERFSATLAQTAADGQPGDWWSTADSMVESAIEYLLDNRDLIEIMSRQDPYPSATSDFVQTFRATFEPIRTAIELGIEAGEFEVSDPATTAVLLFHAIEGAVTRAVLYEERVDKDRIVGAAKELVRKALAPSR